MYSTTGHLRGVGVAMPDVWAPANPTHKFITFVGGVWGRISSNDTHMRTREIRLARETNPGVY